MNIRRIAFLMTCFNRREFTLASLDALFRQQGIEGLTLTVFLVDDHSSDGTAAAVAASFPQVRVLHGDGSLYWGGGTSMAFAAALAEGFDAYVWLNDDSFLYPDALRRLIACAEEAAAQGAPAVVAGSMRDGGTGEFTYGGYHVRMQGPRVQFLSLPPDDQRPLPCDTMNGNFVLIPDVIARGVGNIDPAFVQQRGDVDYGLRARQAGFSVLIAPGYLGECSQHEVQGTWRDMSLSLGERWRDLRSPKGVPMPEWIIFVRRYFGWRWPLYAFNAYIKVLLGLKC